jgi:hypothetical protein
MSSMYRVLPYSAISLTTFELYRDALQERPWGRENKVLVRFAAGAAAGPSSFPASLSRTQARARARAHRR